MVRIKVSRFKSERFLQLLDRQFRLSCMREVCGEIGSGGCRIRLQSHRRLQMFKSFGILGFGGVDEPQELMHLKALWRPGQKFFELGTCLCKLSGVVLRYGGLKLVIEVLTRGVLGNGGQSAKQRAKKQQPKLRPLCHVPHLCEMRTSA